MNVDKEQIKAIPVPAPERLTRRQKKIAKLKAKISAGKYRIDNYELAKALICAH